MTEFDLIRRFFSRPSSDSSIQLGVGDDAALVAPRAGMSLAIAADTMNEGRHFFPDVPPETLGHKILAVNLSDMAAMGALPRWALLCASLPELDEDWIAHFAKGFTALADRFHVTLIGGDTTRGAKSFSLTILGEVPIGKAIQRDGAKVGDDIWVSGTLGGAALAVAAISGETRLEDGAMKDVRRRLELPEPRVELGLALRGIATAALDISDGLTGDIAHIMRRSHVGAEIALEAIPANKTLEAIYPTTKGAKGTKEFERASLEKKDAAQKTGARALSRKESDVPRRNHSENRAHFLNCLLAGGDDYELCFTAPRVRRDDVLRASEKAKTPVTRIGRITDGSELVVLDNGTPMERLPSSYDHFA
jgi:thiamine-monophosphate kinase